MLTYFSVDVSRMAVSLNNHLSEIKRLAVTLWDCATFRQVKKCVTKVSNLYPHGGGIIDGGDSTISKGYPEYLSVHFGLVFDPSFGNHVFSGGKTGKFKDVKVSRSNDYHGSKCSWVNMPPPFLGLPKFRDRPFWNFRIEVEVWADKRVCVILHSRLRSDIDIVVTGCRPLRLSSGHRS